MLGQLLGRALRLGQTRGPTAYPGFDFKFDLNNFQQINSYLGLRHFLGRALRLG